MSSPTFRADLGLDLMERAQARGAAYHQGLDDAIDGKPARLVASDNYLRGYHDGQTQLATYTPEQNPYARR